MGQRKNPRVKMVVPVRLWGTDSAGNPFNILAHTLNVSSSGARIGGVRVALAVGEAVTLQYKQVRALFKVVWIGRPGDKTEQQIGLHLLEQDRQVWMELEHKGTYLDDFSGNRRPPLPTPAPPPAASPAAEPGPAAQTEVSKQSGSEAPQVASRAAATDAVRTLTDEQTFADPNEMMRVCARALLRVEEAVKIQPPDPGSIQEFRDALSKVRQTVWALQQWHESKAEGRTGFPLLSYLNSERLRFIVQATNDLGDDIDNKGVEVDPALLQALFRHVDRLKGNHSPQPNEFVVEVVPPESPAKPATSSPMSVAMRTAATDARRSNMNREESLQFLSREIQRIVGADGVALARLEGREMVCEASSGNAAEPGMVLEIEFGIGAEAMSTNDLAYCVDTQRDARVDAHLCREANIGAVIMVPVLGLEGKPIGMMEVSSSRARPFNDEHLLVLRESAKLVSTLLSPKSSVA
jgi:putative methionine-R-sulfoxide reductase with GAF domain